MQYSLREGYVYAFCGSDNLDINAILDSLAIVKRELIVNLPIFNHKDLYTIYFVALAMSI